MRIHIHIEDEIVKQLDEKSKKEYTSRTALIKIAILEYLHK